MDILARMIYGSDASRLVNGKIHPAAEVKQILQSFTKDHFTVVMDAYVRQQDRIRNPEAWLKTVLVQCVVERPVVKSSQRNFKPQIVILSIIRDLLVWNVIIKVENEPNLTWNKRMCALIREMIHFKNGLNPEDKRDPDQIDPPKVAEFEARYDDILKLAASEYEYVPPSKYYRDGFNLAKRMREFRSAHLLFLNDRRVPHTQDRWKADE